MKLNYNLQLLRKRNGIFQEELAEACAVSRQAVNKWESGESLPTIEKLIFLAKFFEVTLDELVGTCEFDDLTWFSNLLKKFLRDDIPVTENDEATNVILRYINFCRWANLDANTSMEGFKYIFCKLPSEAFGE